MTLDDSRTDLNSRNANNSTTHEICQCSIWGIIVILKNRKKTKYKKKLMPNSKRWLMSWNQLRKIVRNASLLIWQKSEEHKSIKSFIETNALARETEEKVTHLEILWKRKGELISEIKNISLKMFLKKNISYTRENQSTNKKTYTYIEWP